MSNTGIEYDKLIQGLTWESLDDIMRYNLESLYPDVKREINYLKDEERLYIFFKNHPVPTDADFKKLAEEITNSIPWDIIEHFRKIKLDYATRFLDGYTASFQGRDIIKENG